MNRPSFFLSSTIYDFRDLRSSIKYFLEELGYLVLASEFNDFPKPLDKHSYTACLETLQKADYFILLIGNRVGGWYDQEEKISITRQEYRDAYKLHQQGKLKIITLVRREVWQYREQRKELSRFLKKSYATEKEISEIVNADSKFATDAEAICAFIDEVSRNTETSKAVKEHGQLPTGNWVHTFETFRDISDVIRSETLSGEPLEKLAFKRLLSRELTEILKTSLVKFDQGKVYSPFNSLFAFRKEHTLTMSSRQHSMTEVVAKRWGTISTFAISMLGVKIQAQVLDRAIESPLFLRFNAKQDQFEEEPVFKAIYQLRNEIRLLSRANTTDVLEIVFEYSPKNIGRDVEKFQMDTMKLLQLLHLLERWVNVIQLSAAILKHLQGEEFNMPFVFSGSPIEGMDKELEKEKATDLDVSNFLHENKNSPNK